MIKFERCFDAVWIHKTITAPEVIKESFPDGMDSMDASQIDEALKQSHLHFIRMIFDDCAIGFFLLEDRGSKVEIHTVIPKEYRGKAAFKVAKQFPLWFFENYKSCQELITQVPKNNKSAALFAARGGMKKFSENGDYFTKNGVRNKMIVYFMERGE